MAIMVPMGSGAEEATIKLTKINIINKEENKGEWIKKLPYELVFTVEHNNTADIVKYETQSVLRAKEWRKRFYRDKNDNLRYSKEFELNALMEIFKSRKDQQVLQQLNSKEFDIESFMNKPFPGAVIKLDTGVIIDWVETFKLNEVEVPLTLASAAAQTATAPTSSVDALP